MSDRDEGRDFEAEVEAALAELARLYPVDDDEEDDGA